jgi:hypothetical protein
MPKSHLYDHGVVVFVLNPSTWRNSCRKSPFSRSSPLFPRLPSHSNRPSLKIDTVGKVHEQRWPMAAVISFNRRFSVTKTATHAQCVSSILATTVAPLSENRGMSHQTGGLKNAVLWNIKPSSYLTRDTLHLRYRAQPVNAMYDLRFSRWWLRRRPSSGI